MEARELRIGNYIRHIKSGKIHTVHVIEWEDILCKTPTNEGVPLTEEILLKCGFDKYSDHSNEITYLSKDAGYFIQVYDNSVYFGLNYEDYRKEVKYLHQLQNLYFALTSEELEVNL